MSGDIRQTLRSSRLFASLSDDGLDRLVDVGRVEYWPSGSDVVEEGAQGPRMMVILEGRAEVQRRDPSGVSRAIAQMSQGDVIGEIALLLDLPRTASVRALSDLRVFAIDRRIFDELVDAGDPAALRFGLELSRVLAQRLLRLNERVVDLLMHADGAEPLRERFHEARQEIFNLWDYE